MGDISARIIGKSNNSGTNEAGVTEDDELCVIGAPYPPLTIQKVHPLRQYLTTDGLPGGTNGMNVDGSSTNVDYYIQSDPLEDRYITTLNFIIAYNASGKPFQWADGSALTNGSRLFYDSIKGKRDIHDSIKTNQDFFRLHLDFIPTAWEVRHVGANNDYGYFITLDLTKLGLPFGVKLDRGSEQRLTMRIRDNAGTDADIFNCIVYGFDRFE